MARKKKEVYHVKPLTTEIEDWQTRPLDSVYPIVFIDAVHFIQKNPLHFCRGVFRTLFNSDGPKSVPND